MDDQNAQIFKYWRDGYICHARQMEAETPPKHGFLETKSSIYSGRVSLRLTEKIFTSPRLTSSEISADEHFQLRSLPVIVAPVSLKSLSEHRLNWQGAPRVVYPLWIPAVLSEDGTLSLASGGEPWISKSLLEPASGNSVTSSSFDKLDDFLFIHHPIKDNANWDEVMEFCEKMIFDVFGQPLSDFALPNYETDADAFLFCEVHSESVNMLLKVYDELLLEERCLSAANGFIQKDPPPVRAMLAEAEVNLAREDHIAHMKGARLLYNSEREALHHVIFSLSQSSPGPLAVTTPSGTGSILLMQDAVLNMWVQAAVCATEPPLCLAITHNKMSAQNLAWSFEQTHSGAAGFVERWIPSASGYTRNLDSAIPTSEVRYESFFLKHFFRAFPHIEKKLPANAASSTSIQAAVETLHEHLTATVNSIRTALQLQQELNEVGDSVKKRFKEGVEVFISRKSRELRLASEALERYEGAKTDWQKHCNETPSWMRAMSFLWFVQGAKKQRDIDFFQAHAVDFKTDGNHGTDHDPMSYLDVKIGLLKQEIELVNSEIAEAQISLLEWEQKKQLFAHWAVQNAFPSDENIDSFLDRNHRQWAFELTTHYWEARWLRDVSQGIPPQAVASSELTQKLHLQAKLTPFFISSAQSCANTVLSNTNHEKIEPWFDLITTVDSHLLAVESALPLLAFGKKALVLGDISMLGLPRYRTRSIDEARLQTFAVLSDCSQSGIENFMDTGRSISAGSLMHAALSATRIRCEDNPGGSLFLREVIATSGDLVECANALVYKDHLEPIKSEKSILLPCFGFFHVASAQKNEEESDFNEFEANIIVQWLRDKREILESFYERDLRDIVAIVTPYASQKNLISKFTNSARLSRIAVSTLNHFQAHEKPIVILSTVRSGSEITAPLLFDKNPLLLNTAIMKARDSFLVFGDMDVLEKQRQGTVSFELANWLFAHAENNLTERRILSSVERPAQMTDPVRYVQDTFSSI